MKWFYPTAIVVAVVFLFFAFSGVQQIRALRGDLQKASLEMPEQTLKAIEGRYGIAQEDMGRMLNGMLWASAKVSSLQGIDRLSGVEFVYHNFGVALELALMRLEQTSNEAMKDLTYEEYEKIKTSEFPRAKRFLKALGYTVSVPIVSQTKDGATSATQTPVPATGRKRIVVP